MADDPALPGWKKDLGKVLSADSPPGQPREAPASQPVEAAAWMLKPPVGRL